MTTFWRKVVVTLGYIASGIIILAAVIVSMARLLTPILNDHRVDFEKYASRLLDRPVHIEQVMISWNICEPELSFQNVTLLDQQTQQPILNIPLIKINLAIWRSLLSFQPIMETMTVSGAHITLYQKTSSSIGMEGFNNFELTDNISGRPISANAVFAWIFAQSNLILQNIDIQFIHTNSIANHVKVKSLALHNTDSYHELMGDAILSQQFPTQATIDFKWNGSLTDLSHVSAHLYLYVKGISLPQWISEQTWHDLNIMQGMGSAKIDAFWSNNSWTGVKTTLQFYNVVAESRITKNAMKLSRVSGNFGWQREGNNQVVFGDNLLIDLPHHLWPSTNFTVRFTELPNGSIAIQNARINYFDIADSMNLAINSGLLPATYQEWITKLNPRGEIRDLNIEIHGPLTDVNNFSVSGEFFGITTNTFEKIPAVSHLNGMLNWNGKVGDFKLDGKSMAVTVNPLFDKPLRFDRFIGNVHWQKDTTGAWIFNAKGVQAVNKDLNAISDVTLIIPQNDTPQINLSGRFTLLNVANISHYLPLGIFKPDLRKWLSQAFLSGRATDGVVLLQGRLTDFPFDNAPGKFLISGNPEDVELNYAPGWPMIHHASGKLVFSGRSMTINLTKGLIQDVPITSAYAEIPYLGDDKPTILNVQGVTQSDLKQSLQFIHNSPLQKTIGKNLSELEMQGPTQLTLGLSIPLARPKETKVDGKVTLSNATLHLPDWDLSLNQLNGAFNFTEDNITASNMTGLLFSHPVQVDLGTQHPSGKAAFVTADLQGIISTNDLIAWAKLPLADMMQGTTKYHAELQLPSQGTSQPTQVIIQSDLQGIAVNLPDSYGKKADSTSDFQLTIFVNDDQPLKAKLNYNKLFSAAFVLKKDKQVYQLLSGDVNLGSGEANWQNQPGIIITGTLDQLDWDKIQPYVIQFTSPKKSLLPSKTSFLTPEMFRGINIQVKTANFAGLKLKNIRIQLSRSGNNHFLLGLNSAEMAGQISIPRPGSSQLIQAQFQYLRFTSDMVSGGTTNINPKTLPPISFVGGNVQYDDIKLGQVTLNLIPNNSGLSIRQLDLDSKAYTLHANGEWVASRNQTRSHLQGTITTSDLASMLNAWGFAHPNLVGNQGSANFNLSWLGSPFKPSPRELAGNMSLKLGAGRIVNLSEETNAKMGLGRILNVFSLQNLPRRLSLNFSDVFEKGYSFDYMKGDFTLKNGSAFTQNIRFDGPIAGIGIAGRIGLIAKDFDLKLNVTPYVTGSLPVVAAIATVNPLAGFATWLVGHAVSSIITYNYTITGPWDNPIWTQTGSQKSTKPVPAR